MKQFRFGICAEPGRVAAAACILPLTRRTDINQNLGTRHRASIGISESSDAYCFVISEERGTISMAHNGVLKENYDSAALRQELAALFGSARKQPSLRQWIEQKKTGGANK